MRNSTVWLDKATKNDQIATVKEYSIMIVRSYVETSE